MSLPASTSQARCLQQGDQWEWAKQDHPNQRSLVRFEANLGSFPVDVSKRGALIILFYFWFCATSHSMTFCYSALLPG